MPERHVVQVTDEERVVAVHHPADGENWIVFCHGLRSDKSGSYEGRCERAVEAGYDAVRFDFRGCGESDGTFARSHLSARIDDLRAILEFFDPASCALFGSSFGGAVAFHVAASDDGVTAVATRAPVTDTDIFDGPETGAERSDDEAGDDEAGDDEARNDEFDDAFYDDVASYDVTDVAESLDVPVCIVHGRDDDVVPIDDSFRAARALSTDVLLQQFAGEGHRFGRAAEERLRKLLVEWLAREHRTAE